VNKKRVLVLILSCGLSLAYAAASAVERIPSADWMAEEGQVEKSGDKGALNSAINTKLAGYWKWKPPKPRYNPPVKPKRQITKKRRLPSGGKHASFCLTSKLQGSRRGNAVSAVIRVTNNCRKSAKWAICVSKSRNGRVFWSRGYSKKPLAAKSSTTHPIRSNVYEKIHYKINQCAGPGCVVSVSTCR